MPEQNISQPNKQRTRNRAFRKGFLDRGDGHKVYYEECGNPNGIPVLVVHGGRCDCSPTMRRFFDPDAYYIILFDQRGCGRSKPYASVENNSTWYLVSDMEAIRKKLSISKLVCLGVAGALPCL